VTNTGNNQRLVVQPGHCKTRQHRTVVSMIREKDEK
jgi:hypothetical protein